MFYVAPRLNAQSSSESITVTATRTETRIADTPASVVVLSSEELAQTASVTADDALRQVPGFSLFRRTGSRVANPTSQGVSLRGIGASGASRALVLDDGIPLNDPFGGWIYWGRVPLASLQRVEVLRGGASDLYGSAAMGGVIQFIRRSEPALVVDASAGSQETGAASFFLARGRDEWRASLAADLFTTGGYVLVEHPGAVDREADSRHVSLDGTIERGSAFVRASFYDESRNNGTELQVNDTRILQLAAGGELRAGGGLLTLRGYGSDQDYRQTFSAIADDRGSERLTIDQRVPSRSAGGSAQWARPVGTRHALVAGVDARNVTGTSDETRFTAAGTFNGSVSGRQRSGAAFVEDVMMVTPALSITAGLRFDDWHTADRDDSAWSPRLSMLWRANEAVAFTASAYQSFRAPTLNELYRGFRVGNVVTEANAALGAEQLSAIEAGVRFGAARVNLFWMETDDTIANVTLSVTPSLITRQRQNVGRTRARGAEVEGDWRVAKNVRISAGWLFTDSTVIEGPLAGKHLPQVPRNQATAQLSWTAVTTIAVQTRWSALQYDDDLNDLPLRGYFAADAMLSHPIRRGVDATFAVENLFDRRIEASATPVITLGAPRSVRVGVRVRR